MEKLELVPTISKEEWEKLDWQHRETGAYPSPDDFWIEGYDLIGYASLDGAIFNEYLFQKDGQMYIYRQTIFAKVILRDGILYAGEGESEKFCDIGEMLDPEKKKLAVKERDEEQYMVIPSADVRFLYALEKRGCKYRDFGMKFTGIPVLYKDTVEELAKWRGYTFSDSCAKAEVQEEGKMLNAIRKNYEFWTVDSEENKYYLLDEPSVTIVDKNDPQVAWDGEENHISVAAYMPGRLIHDEAYSESEYKIMLRVVYLDFEINDEEIEKIKKLDAEGLKHSLYRRKVINREEVSYTLEGFKKQFWS